MWWGHLNEINSGIRCVGCFLGRNAAAHVKDTNHRGHLAASLVGQDIHDAPKLFFSQQVSFRQASGAHKDAKTLFETVID